MVILLPHFGLVLVHVELVEVLGLSLLNANRALASKLAICYDLVLLLGLLFVLGFAGFAFALFPWTFRVLLGGDIQDAWNVS